MTRFWLTAPAVFALTTGGALAPADTTISTQAQTTVPAPAIGSYSATETEKSSDGMRTVTSKTQTYKSGGMDSTATTRTVKPGGSQTKTMEQTATLYGTTTTKTSTTTTE